MMPVGGTNIELNIPLIATTDLTHKLGKRTQEYTVAATTLICIVRYANE